MKKLLMALLLAATVSLSACSADVQTVEDYDRGNSMFVVAERADYWIIVYHKTTRVMYAVSFYDNTRGYFTLLVNADGTPMTYRDGKDIPRVTP